MGNSVIPGSETVGFACDIVNKPYTTQTSPVACLKALRIFELGTPTSGQEWTEQTTGVTYWIPPGLETPGAGDSTITARSATSRSEFAESFKSHTNVSGKYLGFSAQLDASYSSSQQNSSENDYAYVVQNGLMWTVALNPARATLTQDFQQALSALPSTFDPKNPAPFFNFFDKWGTHYAASAEVGGRLYYYASVAKSSSASSRDLQLNIEAEYKGLIASSKVESQNEWKKTTSQWNSSRQSHIVSIGPGFQKFPVGDFLDPPEGTRLGLDAINDWQDALQKDPRTVGATFAAIFDAVSDPELSQAIKTAMDAWGTCNVTVQTDGLLDYYNPSLHATPALLVNGRPVELGKIPEQGAGGVMFAVLDRNTLSPRHAAFYGPPSNRTWDLGFLDDLRANANEYATGNYIVVLATYGPNAYHMYPGHGDAGFFARMESWGAGNELQKWAAQSPSGSLAWSPHAIGSGTPQEWGYVLVGANDLGVGNGVEQWIQYNSPNGVPVQAQELGLVAYLSPSIADGAASYTPKLY